MPLPTEGGLSAPRGPALKGNPEIGDLINKKIVGPLVEANRLSDMREFNDKSKLGGGIPVADVDALERYWPSAPACAGEVNGSRYARPTSPAARSS